MIDRIEGDMNMNGLMNKIFSGIMMALVLWLGKTTLDLTITTTELKIEVAALKASVNDGTASRYTSFMAARDWQSQEHYNVQVSAKQSRLEGRLDKALDQIVELEKNIMRVESSQ